MANRHIITGNMLLLLLLLVFTCTNMVHSETASNEDHDKQTENAISAGASTSTSSTTSSSTQLPQNQQQEEEQGEDEDASTTPQGTLDILDHDDRENQDDGTPVISGSEADDMTGGGVWSSIGMIAVVICGCICLERLYSSCKKVYQKRTGRYGFSRLHNQTFNEYGEDEEDDDDLEENLGHNITTKNHDSDQESV